MNNKESSESTYKFDVSFSFLERDEDLAVKLCELLKGRLNTFIYPHNQRELIGADGEEKFNAIFGKESRIVVVLYREEWGDTPWTRIESTAIRNRGYEEGFDFCLFVVLEKDTPPRWLPKNRIWASFEKWGIEGLAPVIEARAVEVGADVKNRNSLELLDGQIAFLRDKKKILSSEEGVRLATQAIAELFAAIGSKSSSIATIKPRVTVTKYQLIAISGAHQLIINWHLNWANSLDYSKLTVRLFHIQSSWQRLQEEDCVFEEEYDFDLNEIKEPRWRGGTKFLTTALLAEHCLKELLQLIKRKEVSD